MVTKKSDKSAVGRAPAKRARVRKSRNIWRELSEVGSSIPPSERSALPRDGARNLDHYLDGSPKEE